MHSGKIPGMETATTCESSITDIASNAYLIAHAYTPLHMLIWAS